MRGHYLLAIAIILLLGALAALNAPDSLMAQLPATPTPFGQDPFATPVPFFTPTEIPTPTPLITPSPTSAAPGCFDPLAIEAGSTITVRGGVNIRSAPSISAPWLANFPEFRNFIAVEGPVCGDNYLWWRIRGHGVTGWVAERNNAMSFITSVQAVRTAVVCPTPLELAIGEQIELVTGVRVREEPSLQSRVITVAPLGGIATILSGPTCAEGYNWRRVQVTVANFPYEGWLVEGSSVIPDTFYLEITPEVPCLPPLALAPGDRARVGYRDGMPKNLRAAPGEDGEVLYTLVIGVPFEITGGPVCIDGMNWWQVRILSTIPAAGWLAEGGPRGNYWIRPARDIGAESIPTVTPLPTRPG
jgi:hypothetical protein